MAMNTKCDVNSALGKRRPPFRKDVLAADDAMLCERLIQQYVDLQRIKTSVDKKKEIDYQIRAVKAKLEAFSVVTEDLDIHKT